MTTVKTQSKYVNKYLTTQEFCFLVMATEEVGVLEYEGSQVVFIIWQVGNIVYWLSEHNDYLDKRLSMMFESKRQAEVYFNASMELYKGGL